MNVAANVSSLIKKPLPLPAGRGKCTKALFFSSPSVTPFNAVLRASNILPGAGPTSRVVTAGDARVLPSPLPRPAV